MNTTYSTKWIVLGWYTAACHCIEQGRLAIYTQQYVCEQPINRVTGKRSLPNVGHANNAHFEIVAWTTENGFLIGSGILFTFGFFSELSARGRKRTSQKETTSGGCGCGGRERTAGPEEQHDAMRVDAIAIRNSSPGNGDLGD